MPSLYETYLPIVQDLNTYGGNITSFHIYKVLLDEIDAGAAASDATLEALRGKLADTMGAFKGLQDHQTFSSLFEALHEAVFYLVAKRIQAGIQSVPAGGKHGKTADFTTTAGPLIRFEVKTIDVAEPASTYNKSMEEGLDASLEASRQAHEEGGIGMVARAVAPHGRATDRREAIEQVMRKIDGNVKKDQYAACPTFLVVSTARTALHGDADNLKKRFRMSQTPTAVSGQLFAIAAHRVGEEFYFFAERECDWLSYDPNEDPISLGALNRNGILLDHPYIAGIIFLDTELNNLGSADPIGTAYKLHGVWNLAWERQSPFGPAGTAAAKDLFQRVCIAFNDSDDRRPVQL